MYFLRVFLFVITCCFASSGFSQTDSNVVVVDSTLRNPEAKNPPVVNTPKDTIVNLKTVGETKQEVVKDSARLALEALPRIAGRRSAIIPGWGQVTNGRWWKVPVIYGGFVGLGLIFEFNHRYYKKFLTELQLRDAEPGKTFDKELERIDDQGLIQYKDYYRRTRDLSVLAGVGLYAINIIDAYIDAKFFRYDISDKLSLKIVPSIIPSVSHAYLSPAPAIKIQMKL